MPELPEMEVYRRHLEQHCRGRRLERAEVGREKSLNLPAPAFAVAVEGAELTGFSRAGKMLVFHLGPDRFLLNHLMLGGALFFGTPQEAPERTFQLALHLDGGRALFWTGLRLGWAHLLSEEELQARTADLGLDPLAPAFTLTHVAGLQQGRRSALKSLLVDQRFFPGVGNCYADEICWHARVHPLRVAGTLLPHEQEALWRAIRSTLSEAVSLGGYTETPFVQGDRLSGGYLPHLKVYDRRGEACPRCGAAIVLAVASGRKTFACPLCQPGPG